MKYIDRFKTMDDFLSSELKQLTGDRIATIDGFNLPILKKKMKTVVTVDPSTNEEVETEELQDVWSVPVGEVEKKVDHDYKLYLSFYRITSTSQNYTKEKSGNQTYNSSSPLGIYSKSDDRIYRQWTSTSRYKIEGEKLVSDTEYITPTDIDVKSVFKIYFSQSQSSFSADQKFIPVYYVEDNGFDIENEIDGISITTSAQSPLWIYSPSGKNYYVIGRQNGSGSDFSEDSDENKVIGQVTITFKDNRDPLVKNIEIDVVKLSPETLYSQANPKICLYNTSDVPHQFVNDGEGNYTVNVSIPNSCVVNSSSAGTSYINWTGWGDSNSSSSSPNEGAANICIATDNYMYAWTSSFTSKFEWSYTDPDGVKPSISQTVIVGNSQIRGLSSFPSPVYENSVLTFTYSYSNFSSRFSAEAGITDKYNDLTCFLRGNDLVTSLANTIQSMKIILTIGTPPIKRSTFIAGDTPQGDFGATWYDSSVYGRPCCNLPNEDLGLSFYYSDLKVINETSTDNGSTWVPDASAVLVDGNDVTVTYITAGVEGSGMTESLYPTTSLYAPDGGQGGSVVFNSIQGTADSAVTYNVGLSYNGMSYSDAFTIIWGDPSSQGSDSSTGDSSTGDSSTGDSSIFGENDMTITPCTIDDNYSGALYSMNSTVPTEFTVTIPEYTGMPASWMDVTVTFDSDIRKADSMMPDMMMNDWNATVSTSYTSDGVVVTLSNLSSASHYQYNITFTYNDTTYCARLDFTTGGTPAPMTRRTLIASSTPADDYEMTFSQEYMTPSCNLSNSNLNVSFDFSDLKVITETSTDNGMTWDTSSTDLLDGDDVNVIYITAAPAGTTGEDITLTPTVTDEASDGTTGGSKSFSGITGTADSAITYYIALGYDSASTMYEFTIIWGDPSNPSGGGNDPSSGDSSAGDSSVEPSVEPAVNHYYSLSFPTDPSTAKVINIDVSNGNPASVDVSLMLWEGDSNGVLNDDSTLCVAPDYSTMDASVTWCNVSPSGYYTFTRNNDSITLTHGKDTSAWYDRTIEYWWNFSCQDPDDQTNTLTSLAPAKVKVDWWQMILDSSVGDNVYRENASVTSVKVSEGVTYVGESAFNGCSNLTKVSLPNTLTTLGIGALWGTAITSIVFPSGINSSTHEIGYGMCKDCTHLTSVTIPSTITKLGQYTFAGCTSLTSITIPSSITAIENYAFQGCTSLTSVTFEGTTPIAFGSKVFDGCTSLTSVTIPYNSTYSTGSGSRTFPYDCTVNKKPNPNP